MRKRKLLVFLLCFVLLVASLAVVASAKGAETTESYTEVTNDDGTVTTKYGTIPKTYASKDTYPFVVFKYKNGVYDSTQTEGSGSMGGAMNLAKTWNTKNTPDGTGYKGDIYTAVVLMRKNYTTVNSSATKADANGKYGDSFDNYAQNEGLITLDLNGYTLTQHKDTTGLFYKATTKGSSTQGYIFSTEYIVKNGNIAINTNPVFYGNMWNSVYGVNGYSMANKHFTWNFENVNFEYVKGANEASMLMGYAAPDSGSSNPPDVEAPFTFNYEDCTFDLTNAPYGVTLFNAAPGNATTNYWLKVTVNVTGCEIVAPSSKLAGLKLATVESNHNSGSTVNFIADENGDVFTLNVTDGGALASPISSSYVTVDGKKLYWHNVDGKYVLTECAADAHACSCGKINTECTDANSDNLCDECGAKNIYGKWLSEGDIVQYPFMILDASKNYVSLQATWSKATNAAKSKGGYTILLLRDYVNFVSDSNNLKNFNGTLNVDLNGYILTRDYNGSYILDNYWDASTTADAVTVNFKNGTINAEKWLICVSGSDGIDVEKTANVTFDNVDFKFASNNDKNDGWIFVAHTGKTYDKMMTWNITFTDCTFDTTDMRSSIAMDKAPALNLDVNNKNGEDYIKVKLTVNGGKIIANRFEKNALYQLHSDDIVIFGKGTDNEYLTLEMPDGKAPNAPTTSDYFVVEEKNTYFHKTGNVYTLTECLDSATHHECTCGVVYTTECIDENKDHSCDICGAKSDCIDEDKNHVCDLCDKTLACIEIDTNNDHVCDSCGEKFDFIDANHDELCDHCGYVVNDYGIVGISETYASTEKYPFFVLKLQNGVYTFENATSTLYGRQSGGAVDYAIYTTLQYSNRYNMETSEYEAEGSAAGVATAIVVMRRDYAAKMGNDKQSASEGVEWHNNIAHAQGHIIVDLGGYTLSEAVGSNKSVFTATVKGWTGSKDGVYTSPSTYTFKNGNVKVINYAFATVGTSDQVYTDTNGAWSVANNPFTLEFENVNFGFAAGATTASLAYANGGATQKNDTFAKVNVSFTDCTFDLVTNAISSAITLVNNSDNGKDVDCDIVVNGCEIIASSMANVTVYKTAATHGSSLSVVKGDNGKYITLTMPKGSTAPAVSNTVTLDSGVVAAFVKNSTIGGNDNYQLYPAVMIGYKVKTSVTLYSNFVYNIYIPKANVKSFTVGGKTVQYTETKIDGVDYYHVAVNIPAAECLNDIALKVTLNSGSTTVDAGWTLSVLKYAGAVIGGSYDDVTKLLMKDMLVYASAAHTYFKNELGATKANTVEALLGTYSAEMPDGTAVKPSNETYFTIAEVFVGEVPSFRFYLAGNYTADDFVFTVGGKEVDVTEEGGYVEIAMYAYMMLENVSFTVKGTEVSESYNLYSYLAYAKTLNVENLVPVVEGLMKYSASAKNYRDYVIENTCYHNYEDGKCTKCGEDDPDVGTMSLSAPASIYSNYPGKDISVSFSKDWYNGEVTYTTNNPNVFVENGKIFAVEATPYSVFPRADQGSETVTITATTEHHTATATVNVSTYRTSSVDVESKAQYYEKNIIKEENKGGTIFIGDSYFDGVLSNLGLPPFWTDFYEDWAGEKAFLMGMSSSKIGELEVASERIVYPMEPSEIIVHIGHNDMHHSDIAVDEFVARLTALFNEFHTRLPGVKIYYVSADPKKAATPVDHERHESSFVRVPAVNAAMKALADTTDWLTYVDTTYIFYNGDGTAVNTNMYPSGDGSHPSLYAYDLMRFSINEARGVANQDMFRIDNLNGGIGTDSSGKQFTEITAATGDYVISGKLAITALTKSNAHIHFRFESEEEKDCRFVFWDANSDGVFGNGRIGGDSTATSNDSDKTNDAFLYDANNGLVVEWAVVVTGGKAYWYIDGKLVQEMDTPNLTFFKIQGAQVEATVFDIKLDIKNEDATAYNAHANKYVGERVYVEKYGNNESISTSGKTYTTDLDGNTLTNTNYIAKGKLQAYKIKNSNPHLQFRFNSSYRFLIWDSDSDYFFGIGDNSTNDTKTGEIYNTAKSGYLILEWAIVVSDGETGKTADLYINGVKMRTFTNIAASELNIGALQMNVLFYDIEIYAENGNAEKYNAAVSQYK